MSLFAARYECRYRYKPFWALYTNCSFLGTESFALSTIDGVSCFYLLNPNFGLSHTLLHNKLFSWRVYAGIGVMWGARLFRVFYYVTLQDETERDKKIKDYRGKGSFIDLLKDYFSSGNICSNLKHFDIVIDLSAFDFIIKDHWRINLEWKCGFVNFYKIIKSEDSFSRKFQLLGLLPLVISIGYQF